jgi:hypothetical protein
MSRRKKRGPRPLAPREQGILALADTGIVTIDIVQQVFFPDADVEAVRSAVRRIVERGELRAEPLDAQRCYYRLTRQGARRIPGARWSARPLKKQGRVQRYAVTWFIHAQHPGHRALIRPHDYTDQFAVAEHRLPRGPFYLDRTEGRSRLGIIFVDHNAHYRRMVRKVVKTFGRFLWHGWFDGLIRTDAFKLAILTYSEARRQTFNSHLPAAIVEQFSYPLSRLRPDLSGAVPPIVQIYVVPGLAPIVSEPPPKERRS